MNDDDWDWIFELGFWLFAPLSVIAIVLFLEVFEIIDLWPGFP